MERPTAFVIDPSATLAETIGMVLESRGFKPLVAWQVGVARQLIEHVQAPALIVSHYSLLDEADHGETLEAAMAHAPGAPVIVITGQDADGIPPANGRWVVLRKPFGVSDLDAAIAEAMAGH